MNDPIMVFNIRIDQSEIASLETTEGSVVIIPFTGDVKSELFTGTILPGAADVQICDPEGFSNLCARYMFEGVDSEGKRSHLYVENKGTFNNSQDPDTIISAFPTFITDSRVLHNYLSGRKFRSEVHPTDHGVDILVFCE